MVYQENFQNYTPPKTNMPTPTSALLPPQGTSSPQGKKLLDQMRDALQTQHYSYRTENTYVEWAKRFVLFHKKRHPNPYRPGTARSQGCKNHHDLLLPCASAQRSGVKSPSTANSFLSLSLFSSPFLLLASFHFPPSTFHSLMVSPQTRFPPLGRPHQGNRIRLQLAGSP